jgi:hypothetical protein
VVHEIGRQVSLDCVQVPTAEQRFDELLDDGLVLLDDGHEPDTGDLGFARLPQLVGCTAVGGGADRRLTGDCADRLRPAEGCSHSQTSERTELRSRSLRRWTLRESAEGAVRVSPTSCRRCNGPRRESLPCRLLRR